MGFFQQLQAVVRGGVRKCSHRGGWWMVCAIVVGIVCSCVRWSPVVAEQRELAAPRSALDVVLLVDASGSMMLTDPLRLRYEGPKLLLQFLEANDRVGVVSFAAGAQVVVPLKPFSGEHSEQVVRGIEGIKTEGKFTDIAEGVRVGLSLFEAAPRPDVQRTIVLLSDGKMEPESARGTSDARTRELVSTILPEAKAKDVKIHTLAFSAQADRELLGEIAGATEGLNWFTQEAGALQKSFADLFLAVKRPQVVQLTSRGFRIDDDVEEATFYVNHEEGVSLTLVTPKNRELVASNLPEWATWYAGKNFDVITLREPESGNWQVRGVAGTDGFATVMTNLKLVSDWPSILRTDERFLVQARLYEGQKPIALPEMSGVVQYAFQIVATDKVAEPVVRDVLNDEGQNGDRVARDGIFSAQVQLQEVGEYRITLVARGPTFQRSQQVPFKVRPPLLRLEVGAPRVAAQHGAGKHGEKSTHGDHGAHGGGKPHNEGHGGHDHDAGAHGGEEHTAEVQQHGGADQHGGAGQHGAGDATDAGSGSPVQGTRTSVIRAILTSEGVGLESVQIKVVATEQDGRSHEVELHQSDDSTLEYEVQAAALPDDGQYTLQAFLEAETAKEEHVKAKSNLVIFERRPPAAQHKSRSGEDDHHRDEPGLGPHGEPSEHHTADGDRADEHGDVALSGADVDAESEAEEGAAEAEKFPLGAVLTLTGVNVVFGVLAAVVMRRRMPRSSGVIERYVPPAELLATIETLRAVTSKLDIDPNDTLFESLDADDEGAEDGDPAAGEDGSAGAEQAQHEGAAADAAAGASETGEGATQPTEAGGESEGAAAKQEQAQ